MPASFTSSQHNHTGSSSSKSAGKSPSDEKPSRKVRLDMFNGDNKDDLISRLHDGQSKTQTLEDKLGQHFAKLP
ncbi:hypothetical protein BDP55DRAFT_733035 [Colletotrichum godetiae]|uniref:Uncharacterized protein n=1 Tax=Colletotrichum godetiae TaxID=1209918 RepID=A0AAJ0ESN1_9PEZI|nr:uncharacterized protein BDP55DRAFT_733035 [Colletotrichum godetiae]KAK1659719.1 hypothetical protein BDP55DRAFT_733035 [Colletotrichum godetiae]